MPGIGKETEKALAIKNCVKCDSLLAKDYASTGGLPFCSEKCFDEWKAEAKTIFSLLRFHVESHERIGRDMLCFLGDEGEWI